MVPSSDDGVNHASRQPAGGHKSKQQRPSGFSFQVACGSYCGNHWIFPLTLKIRLPLPPSILSGSRLKLIKTTREPPCCSFNAVVIIMHGALVVVVVVVTTAVSLATV